MKPTPAPPPDPGPECGDISVDDLVERIFDDATCTGFVQLTSRPPISNGEPPESECGFSSSCCKAGKPPESFDAPPRAA